MKISSAVNFGFSINKTPIPRSISINFGEAQDEVHLTSRNNNLYDLEYEMVNNELSKCNPKSKISSSILSLKRILNKSNEQAI